MADDRSGERGFDHAEHGMLPFGTAEVGRAAKFVNEWKFAGFQAELVALAEGGALIATKRKVRLSAGSPDLYAIGGRIEAEEQRFGPTPHGGDHDTRWYAIVWIGAQFVPDLARDAPGDWRGHRVGFRTARTCLTRMSGRRIEVG